MQPETLIITGPKVNTADILSLAAILKTLTGKIHILSNSFVKSKLQNLDSSLQAEFIEKISSPSLNIKLPKQNNSINNVQWQQTDSEVNLQLELGEALLDPNAIKFEFVGASYNQVILFGLNSYEELTTILQANIKILATAKVTIFGKMIQLPNVLTSYFGTNLETSIGEQVFNFSINTEPSKLLNDLVFAAILGGTGRFKFDNCSESTFTACTTLLKNGASIQNANQLLDKVFSSDTKSISMQPESNAVSTNNASANPTN